MDDENSSESIDLIVEETLEQLQRGESVDFAEINRQNSDLQPELESRLMTLERIFFLAHPSGSQETALSPPHQSGVNDGFRTEGQLDLRCPHCGAGIKVIQELDEITCRNCGSSIHVTPHENRTGVSTFSVQIKQLGRFSLGEVVGRGGFGIVYRSYDTQLKRTVAIKLPRDGSFDTPEEEQRFLREARHVAQLNHPNIVPVYEIGRDTDQPYIVSKFIDGMTLSDLINHRRVDSIEAAAIMAKVADAVGYAHEKKITHRDIKPGNILLDHDLEPFVTDFGLARAEDAGEFTITIQGQVVGTPSYMSPEQVKGDTTRIGPLSDVYSLGVVFYRMLTGELPFRGSKRLMMHQIQFEEPRSPRTLNELIPRDLETIALKAMSKEPTLRYQSSYAMAQDLHNAVNGDPISARPVSRFNKFLRLCRRYPIAASLASALAILLLVTAIGGLVWGVRESHFRNNSEEARVLSQFRHARTLISKGTDRLLVADNLGALPWLAKAWEVESDSPDREQLNRLRLGTVLARCPRLVSVKAGDHPISFSLLSPNERFAASGFQNGRVLVWDIRSEEAIVDDDELNDITDIDFGPNERFLAASDSAGLILIWDLELGRRVSRSEDHSERVNEIAFDLSGTRLLSGSRDKTARIWKFQTPDPIDVFPHRMSVTDVAFSMDHSSLITVETELASEQSTVNFFDIESPVSSLVRFTYPQGVKDLSVDHHNKLVLARSYDDRILVWDRNKTSHQSARQFAIKDLVHVQFAKNKNEPQSIQILAANGSGTVFLLSLDTGETTFRMDTGISIQSVAYDSNNQWIAISDEGQSAFVWSVESRSTICSPLMHTNLIRQLQFANQGKHLLTSGQDGFAKVWDLSNNNRAQVIQGEEHFHGALSNSGNLVAINHSQDHRKIKIVSSLDGSVITQIEIPVMSVLMAFSPDDRELAVASDDGVIRIWDVQSGVLLSDRIQIDIGFIRMVYSADGNQIIAADGKELRTELRETPKFRYPDEFNVHVWDRKTGTELARVSHDNFVDIIRQSPDQKYLVTIGMDRFIRVFELETGRVLLKLDHLDKGRANDVQFDDRSQSVIVSFHKTMTVETTRFLNTNSIANDRQQDKTLTHYSEPVQIRLHPQYRTPVVATKNGHVHFWNEQRTATNVIKTSGRTFSAIGFGNDNGVLITSTKNPIIPAYDNRMNNGLIQLWDPTTFEMIGPLLTSIHSPDRTMFSKDGKFIVSAANNGTVTIWQLISETRSVDAVRDICEVLSGHQIGDNSNLNPLNSRQFMERWNRIRNRHPEASPSSYSPISSGD